MVSLIILTVTATVLVQTFAFRLDGRIVGGEDADINDFLYQLSFQYQGSHFCGASMISGTNALTAAHCTDNMPARFLSVRAGSTYHASGGQVYSISIIYQHPDYNADTTDYDVSVLILKTWSSLKGVIRIQRIDEEVPNGATAVVTGWGTTSSGGSNSENLKKVNVTHYSDEECYLAYGDKLTGRMTCYGSPGKDSCQGDSGSPLVYNNHQVGVVSWGNGCADPSYPRVYAKVSESSIHNHITQYMP